MIFNRLMKRAAIVLIAMMLAPPVVSVHAEDAPFPRFPEIEPNVAFWTDIYARYPTTQAVVHDSVHPNVVYGVIDLLPADRDSSRKINRDRMKAARQRYEQVLKRLAADPDAADAECRRVARLFGPDAGSRHFRQASYRVRCQIGQCDRFRAGVIRSGAYLPHIQQVLKDHGLPEDLAYLPHVESSFDISVTSKYGAAGMWQFTRSTGRRFMTIDDVRDERRDPMAATIAAARLLKENYLKLGTWPLAITAYNHGAAGMARAKARHGDYPSIFSDYRGRAFKFASRNFYSEFLAARQVAGDYRRYFGELRLMPPVEIRSVVLDGFAAWADLCGHFDISSEAARAMNPALRPPVFTGQKYVPKGYVFNLPAVAGSEGSPAETSIPLALLKASQRASRFYTVQAGDTASRIARTHRVRLSDLILANNLDGRATVYVNQTLRIPQHGQATTGTAAQNTAAKDSVPVAGGGRHYRRPGPSPAELLAMGHDAAEIPAEQTGAMPDPTHSQPVTARVAISRVVNTAVQPVGIITVEVEETLGHYAKWAGVPAAHLHRLNNLPPGRGLKLHQEIRIPLARVSAERFEARRHAYHQQLQADFFAGHRIGGLQQYRVQPGDSYWSLCRDKFDLPLWLLRHYNAGIDLADLRVHQSLTIPAVVSISGLSDASPTPDA